MKSGDLVKYRHYHNNLQDLVGIVLKVDSRKERVDVLWGRHECNDEVHDWVDDLEVIDESR